MSPKRQTTQIPVGVASWILLVVLATGCGGPRSTDLDDAPESLDDAASLSSITHQILPPRIGGQDRPMFRRVPESDSGIDLVHRFPPNAPFELMTDQYSGSGVCIGDVDADGLPDIYITNYNRGNRLYRNRGGFRFENVTEKAGVGGEGRWCGGACFVDVDNDADLDLCVCVFNAPNLLYINQGDGVFDERAHQRGLDFAGASVMMTFADYDRDGDLDGYLVTHRMNIGSDFRMPRSTADAMRRGIIKRTPDGNGVRVTSRFRQLFELMDRGEGRIELVIAGQQDVLYRNEGDGRFRPVNEPAGISGYGIGLAAAWWDYDSNGLPDLYVSNDYKGADQLYHNNGDGTFTDVARSALPHVPWFSMGSATADVNNDGRIDLLASDMSGTDHFKQKMAMGDMQKDRWFLRVANPQQYMRNALYLNTGTPRLMEVALMAGVANSDWTWSPLFGDLDNDGWVDLFVSNGMSRDFMNSDLARAIKTKQSKQWLDFPIRKESNLVFRNSGGLSFDEVGSSWQLDQVTASYGAAVADLDRDGDLDLVVTNFEDPVHVYQNCGTLNHVVLLRLIGTLSNRWGIGARVEIETAAGTQARCLSSSQGFMSAGEPLVHFGLGSEDHIRRLSVTWPSGVIQSFSDVAANRFYSITEDRTLASSSGTEIRVEDDAWFEPPKRFVSVRHRETQYDDFQAQPLLPSKLSQQGPGLAVGDVNNDGIDDVFLSGAAGQGGQLIDGKTLKTRNLESIEGDARAEQLGALLFDCDADGDRDLYLVSGSVEYGADRELLQDVLYLNDGTGRFTRAAPDCLPRFYESGSCVAAADYDRDGDLDLFVGGRVIPEQYPTSPPSRLLRNEGGRFVLDQASLKEDTEPVVRATSAIWSDVNNDGWIDLLVTAQWGPVRYFQNDEGMLREATDESGLAPYTGWWNGIAAGDLDGDGDMDYVVTNNGVNTKYRASSEHPVVLYYGDFEGHGTKRIVEASFEGDVLYPDRGRSCSALAMPSINYRFPSFNQFALARLEEVYPAERLQRALRLEATTLESGVFLNDGQASFRFMPLPRLAQVSPGYGVVVLDVDGDGNLDIYLVHNSFSPQPETGRMDGGMSLLLRGIGDGSFTAFWPRQSGLIVPGDAKSLAVTDLTDDGRPDFLVGVNDGPLMAFENRAGHLRDFFTVRLRGSRSNPDAIGARVELALSDGTKKTVEVHAGGSYLSQSTAILNFGLGGQRPETITVRWPDGRSSQHKVTVELPSIVVDQPE